MFLLGHLHVRARDAWAMSVVEYDAAWRGYAEKHGLKPQSVMTRNRLEELKALYPDTP